MQQQLALQNYAEGLEAKLTKRTSVVEESYRHATLRQPEHLVHHHQPNLARMRRLFNTVDTNGDGWLTRGEIMDMLRHSAKNGDLEVLAEFAEEVGLSDLVPLVQRADMHDGSRDAREHEAIAGSVRDALEGVFRAIDVDDQRKISFDAFAVFIARCAEKCATPAPSPASSSAALQREETSEELLLIKGNVTAGKVDEGGLDEGGRVDGDPIQALAQHEAEAFMQGLDRIARLKSVLAGGDSSSKRRASLAIQGSGQHNHALVPPASDKSTQSDPASVASMTATVSTVVAAALLRDDFSARQGDFDDTLSKVEQVRLCASPDMPAHLWHTRSAPPPR